jgi:DNA modification methylase
VNAVITSPPYALHFKKEYGNAAKHDYVAWFLPFAREIFRFPAALPKFFLKLLTDEGDLVLDPFAGSNTTGAVAEALHRRWIAVEKV